MSKATDEFIKAYSAAQKAYRALDEGREAQQNAALQDRTLSGYSTRAKRIIGAQRWFDGSEAQGLQDDAKLAERQVALHGTMIMTRQLAAIQVYLERIEGALSTQHQPDRHYEP